MNEHRPDRIDDRDGRNARLTKNAISWWTISARTSHWWAKSTPGAMTAIALNLVGPGPVEISETEPAAAISDLIGDPFVNRINHQYRVAFWVGDNSIARRPIYAWATKFLHQLLVDIRDGNYVASNTERAHARALLLDSSELPVIHGSCLITGIADDADTPAPLSENFQAWFTSLLDDLARLRDSLADAIAHESDIPLD